MSCLIFLIGVWKLINPQGLPFTEKWWIPRSGKTNWSRSARSKIFITGFSVSTWNSREAHSVTPSCRVADPKDQVPGLTIEAKFNNWDSRCNMIWNLNKCDIVNCVDNQRHQLQVRKLFFLQVRVEKVPRPCIYLGPGEAGMLPSTPGAKRVCLQITCASVAKMSSLTIKAAPLPLLATHLPFLFIVYIPFFQE